MWFTCLGLLALLTVVTAWRAGPNQALGTTFLASLLFPKWLVLDVGDMPLDLRVASGIFALSVYCVHPHSVFRTRLIALDYLMILMLVVHAISDTLQDGFHIGIPVRIYGEWMVPYLAGRVSTLNWQHVRSLVPVAIIVICVLVVLGAVESFANWNIYDRIWGIAESQPSPRNLVRWGLIRAYGPTKNPIFFGMLLLLLVPWSVFAAALAYRNAGPKFWLAMPLVALAGIWFSGSRAPLLALAPFAYTIALVQLSRYRRILLGLAIVVVALMAFNATRVVQLLNSWGEKTVLNPTRITVSGTEVEYTSTLHRLYIWEVYGTAMRRAGWLGFGTARTTGFPPQVPMGPEHATTLKWLWCVDNVYVLYVLRFGYLGVATFLCCGLAAAGNYWRLAQQPSVRRRVYSGAMCGAIVATLCALLTVWMPHDFGFLFIWMFGAGAALYSHTSSDVNQFRD